MFKALWVWNIDKITKIKLKFNNIVNLPSKLRTSTDNIFSLISFFSSRFIVYTVDTFLLDY